jgi:hypothetical protein
VVLAYALVHASDLEMIFFFLNVAWCLQADSRATRNFTDYSESEWVADEVLLPALPGGFGWSCPPPKASHRLQLADFQSRLRKVCPSHDFVLVFFFPLHAKRGLAASIGCGNIACTSTLQDTLRGPGESRPKMWL